MKTKMILACGFAASFALASNAGLAQDANNTGSGPNPYSDCGIGAALFPEHNVGATISNVIWDLGTTAVTSATASPETCSGKNVQAAAFIMETQDELVEEAAKGAGKNLTALLNILEVDIVERDQVIAGLRESLGKDLAGDNYLTLTAQERAELFYNRVVSASQA